MSEVRSSAPAVGNENTMYTVDVLAKSTGWQKGVRGSISPTRFALERIVAEFLMTVF
jgi:hypothetical protein